MANWVLTKHQGRGDESDFDERKAFVQVPIYWYERPKADACAIITQRLRPFIDAGAFDRFALDEDDSLHFCFTVPEGEDYWKVFTERAADVFNILGISKTHFACPKVDEHAYAHYIGIERWGWYATDDLIREAAEIHARKIVSV